MPTKDCLLKGNYGAFLIDSDSDIMERIISKLAQNLSVPVTAKIRLPPQKNTACALAKRLENAGCSLLCVHGRTRFENKTKAGRADMERNQEYKTSIKNPSFCEWIYRICGRHQGLYGFYFCRWCLRR